MSKANVKTNQVERFVMRIITALRSTEPYIESIYTKGGCYRFHLFLKELYPDAIPVKNADFSHVGTLIDGECYDITGIVDCNYYAMSIEEIEQAEKWCFTDHNMLLIGECPICDEPLVA
jgi:hypothetical protein